VGRPVVLSNGQLFVGLDEHGLVHDFYYPYVGLENLTNARSMQHKIGIWVGGVFSWVDDGNWQTEIDFEENALISHIVLRNEGLAIELHLHDYIDANHNAFVRHIEILNKSDMDREIRIFTHQVFQISRSGRADTALYVPDVHYSLLIAGKYANGEAFDQYAVGNYAIEGKAGTFKDAEDGELSENAVEHGGVDSVIRFAKTVSAGQTEVLDYWIIAASSQQDAEKIHQQYMQSPMNKVLEETRHHWQNWINDGDVDIPENNRRSLVHSLLVVKAHCDVRGSILASGDSSIFNYGRDYYCYCWPRDAAYALWPMIRLGHFGEAKAFFEFAKDTMHKDGYLMHKYQPDRAIGSTWHPLVHNNHKELAIQEDETAGVIFMIGEFLESSQDKKFVEHLYHSFIVPCANFMAQFIDAETGLPHASYDLWEEKFLTSTYTVCTVIAGLQTAAKLANVFEAPDDAMRWKKAADGIKGNLDKLYHADGYFVKGFLLQEDGSLAYDNKMDISSLYGPFMYAGLPLKDERIMSTLHHVETKILNTSPIGGVLRYENDSYFLTKPYSGNPWIVSTLWLAQFYAAIGEEEKAQQQLQWALNREVSSGILSEQFDPENGYPLSVSPLVWSHAEMINTLLDLSTQ
jgi:GH15 family glucan-1,4-alpha-glucosidase